MGAALAVGVALISRAGTPTEIRRSTTYDGGITAVVVEVDDHDVRVVGSEQGDVRVDRTSRPSGGDEPERVDRRDDGTLVVSARCTARFALVGDGCGGSYDLRVPHGTRVQVVAGTGDVTVEDTRGGAVLRSDDGAVTVTGGHSAVEASTGAGRIRTDVTATRIIARSDDGEVAPATTGPLQAVTASTGVGDITVSVPADGGRYDVEATTGTGRTAVEVPDDPAGAPVRVSSDDGDITIRPRAVPGPLGP